MINQPVYNEETDNVFYAHSTKLSDKSDWQLLKDHLVNVGELAGGFAEAFNCAEYGKVAGLLHDLGKYTVEFQQRLEGKHPRVDHATHGAKIALKKYKDGGYFVAYSIAGHHAGLANGEYRDDKKLNELKKRLEKPDLPLLKTTWQTEIEPLLPEKLPTPPLKIKNFFQVSFLSRMIFSCLVDADRLDTEKFCQIAENKPLSARGQYPSLAELKTQFDQSLNAFQQNDSDINQKRSIILSTVRHNAKTLEAGLFSLTVPTGGGKTLTSMAFALDHAETYQKRRVIYVIPFTSIIEQNADVFRKQFGESYQHAIIEHHSAFNDVDIKNPDSRTKLNMAMENWDAPIIVTTAVQFMESLFSNRPSDCRKLHRIANSVIILDEAQTLPLDLLRPCMAAIDELAKNYGCSIVLCTATQPALLEKEDGFKGGFQNVRELAKSDSKDGINPQQLYKDFQRVSVSHIGELDDAAIIQRLHTEAQILCIVNTRRQAQVLYQGIVELEGSFHLSTYMCAVHRKNVLAKIRFALKRGNPCRVISTSLIEAGVDVDFPCVMRSDAGLDSIAQAAGRCNRESKNKKEDSHVWIFTATDHKPPHELKTYASKMKEVMELAEFKDDLLGLSAIKEYFSRVYWQKEMGQNSELDKHGILKTLQDSKLQNLPFDWMAQKFKMISTTMKTVIVPYDHLAIDYIEQLENLPEWESVGKLARNLQVYTISVPQHSAGQLIKLGALKYVQAQRFGDQFLVLESDNMYEEDIGFNLKANPLLMSGEECVL
ncbi:CRISPR-associated helicase Cas3' [Crenothrix sp.]|uniref:CRISPR-associated helicase Cas3' n=1 Tax=Crenothrix sp. TaxID=3100433 RepID=UPI00374D100E